MTETDTERAKDQAKSQLESIVAMVKRLEHSQECGGGEDCDLTDQEILDGLMLTGDTATEEEREEYHEEEKAREAIEENPLSVQVRSGWANSPKEMEAEEYEILLCTGGPAVRIVGDLNQYNEPETARLEYQDWFTPWEDYHLGDDEKALLSYARQFCFSV